MPASGHSSPAWMSACTAAASSRPAGMSASSPDLDPPRAPARYVRAPVRAGGRRPRARCSWPICWYPTQHVPHPGALADHWVLDPTAAAPFLADVNGFPPPLAGPHGCSPGDGSTALLLFQYSDGYPVWVRVEPTGCRNVDNGTRYAFDIDSQLLDRINHLP
jgi:hypothetical protein